MIPKTVGREHGDSAVMHPVDTGGFSPDSTILTLDGVQRIGDLGPGARVITRDRGAVRLRGLTRRVMRCASVHIMGGSLGHTRPECDVTLPAGQPVLVRDWRARALFGAEQAVVPARRLVDGEFVTLQPEGRIEVITLEFGAPHILYVDGLEVTSHAG